MKPTLNRPSLSKNNNTNHIHCTVHWVSVYVCMCGGGEGGEERMEEKKEGEREREKLSKMEG